MRLSTLDHILHYYVGFRGVWNFFTDPTPGPRWLDEAVVKVGCVTLERILNDVDDDDDDVWRIIFAGCAPCACSAWPIVNFRLRPGVYSWLALTVEWIAGRIELVGFVAKVVVVGLMPLLFFPFKILASWVVAAFFLSELMRGGWAFMEAPVAFVGRCILDRVAPMPLVEEIWSCESDCWKADKWAHGCKSRQLDSVFLSRLKWTRLVLLVLECKSRMVESWMSWIGSLSSSPSFSVVTELCTWCKSCNPCDVDDCRFGRDAERSLDMSLMSSLPFPPLDVAFKDIFGPALLFLPAVGVAFEMEWMAKAWSGLAWRGFPRVCDFSSTAKDGAKRDLNDRGL